MGSEIPTMLQFFKTNFIVLNGNHMEFTEFIASLKEEGLMIRVTDGRGF